MPLLDIYERDELNFIVVYRSIFRTESLTVYSEARYKTNFICLSDV